MSVPESAEALLERVLARVAELEAALVERGIEQRLLRGCPHGRADAAKIQDYVRIPRTGRPH